MEQQQTQMPNPFIGWIESRIRRNKNAIGLFVGATGSGKSLACIDMARRLSESLGTPFSIDDNVAFDFKNMLKKMQLEHNRKPGTVFVLEEVGSIGSGGASSTWQSKANAFFSSFLQTSRHRNQILLLNTPAYGFLMKAGRLLLHFQVEMCSINMKEKISIGKFFINQTNARSGKVYMKYLRCTKNGEKKCYQRMKFHLPPKDMINAYEVEKTKFTDDLNQTIIDSGEDKKEVKEKKKVPWAADIDYDKLQDYMDKGLKKQEISNIFGISRRALYNHIKKLQERV